MSFGKLMVSVNVTAKQEIILLAPLMDFFKIASLDSLIEAGKKYKLNPSAIEVLKAERAKLGQIPDWEYEMDEHPEIMLNKYRASVPK